MSLFYISDSKFCRMYKNLDGVPDVNFSVISKANATRRSVAYAVVLTIR